MSSIVMILLASNLLVMSDRENFWEADKISAQSGVIWDNARNEAPLDLKHLEGKKVLIAVHGFNNSSDRAMTSYHAISNHVATMEDAEGNKLYDVVIGYLWPGYDNSLDYYAAKINAKRLRERMRTHLQMISAAAAKVDILAHSMGNRLVFEALNYTSQQPSKILIENFYSLAPAIDHETIEKKQKYFRSIQNCQDLYVFHSKQDEVLEFLYTIAGCNEALGFEGLENMKKLPKNVQLIDCSSFIAGQSQYFDAPPLYEFIKNEVLYRSSPLGVAKNIQITAKGEVEVIPQQVETKKNESKGILERLKVLFQRLKRIDRH